MIKILAMAILLCVCVRAEAQGVNLKKNPCPGDPSKARLVLYAPASIAGGAAALSLPLCIDLGDDLRIVAGAPGENAKLEVVQRPPAAFPAWRIETVKVPVGAGATLSHTLTATPVAGSPVLAFGRFSNRDAVTAAAVVESGRTVVITLPSGPFSADPVEDVVTLVYQAQAQ